MQGLKARSQADTCFDLMNYYLSRNYQEEGPTASPAPSPCMAKRISLATFRPEKSNDAVCNGTVAFWWASFLAAFYGWLPLGIATESLFPEARYRTSSMEYFDFSYWAKHFSPMPAPLPPL